MTTGSRCQIFEAPHVPEHWKNKIIFRRLHKIVDTIWSQALNSRPITSVSNYANDALALIAGHFLIGRPITALPEPETTGKETFSWARQMQRMDNLIRFLKEVVNRMFVKYKTTEKKWQTGQINTDIIEVLMIKEENTPPTQWPRGRIIKVFDKKW